MSAILIVENDLVARRTLAELLTASGHDVVSVAKPAEVLDYLASADLLILDMDGPGDSILADLDRIRAARAELPIVATASATWHGWRALSTAMRLGSDDLLTKPFDREEVSRIVRGTLARESAATADTAV